MSRIMITTPALNAMSGHGLTDAALIVDGRRTAVAYSVFCPATERYSLVTLDGRWIIPGKEGYKTRGPATTYARRHVSDLRPEALRVYEPIKHTGRPQVGRYGARRSGRCMGQVQAATVGYECGSCHAHVSWDHVWVEGFTIVLDGRGTHTVSYALRSEHRREFGTVPAETPAVKAPTPVDTPAVSAPVAEAAPVPAPVAVATPVAPAESAAPFCAPYSVAEYSITLDVSAVGRIAYGGHKPVKRWKVVDANGRVASDAHLSRLAADVRADILNGESGHAQTPDTCPEGTPDNVRPLVSAGTHGRAYITGGGARLNIESADGRARFTLHTVPDDAHQEARDGFHKRARELSGQIVKRADGRPVFKPAKLQMWSGKPAPRKAFEPKDYAPGSMLAWMVGGVRFTGQVWATRVQGGAWNGDQGEATAVVVATVDGRRARRDEAVTVPLYTGSRRKRAFAHVSMPYGVADNGAVQRYLADVTVIAPECAADGLFDVVTPRVDDMDAWEGEGGAFVREYDNAPAQTPAEADTENVAPVADAPAEAERVVGEYCHRCQEKGLVIAGTCRRCGRVDIVAAMAASGPRTCPAEERAQATGRLYCRRCFRTGVALYASKYWTVDGEGHRFHICADCYTAHGGRLPEAGPAPVMAPAGAVIRAARAARKEAEESGASVGEIHRAGEAARVAVAVAYGQRPADVISDPSGTDGWEGEGGACVGVDRPSAPDAGSPAVPVGPDPSPEMGTCTALAVDTPRAASDAMSGRGPVAARDSEGGTAPGITAPRAHPRAARPGADPYAVLPAVAKWEATPGTDLRTATLTCAGESYRVAHAPDGVLPYTVRRTGGGTGADLGGWVDMDDVRAIIRGDRRRTAALEADRRRVEQEQRRAAYRLQGERRQAPARLTEQERRAAARRTEEKHRPVAAELYVSPITGNAVLTFVCGACATTHDDVLGRPQTIGGRYRTPLSVDRDTLTALVEKRGWKVTGPWTAHGRRGDTMRAPVAATPAYLAWVDATYGPGPVTPEVRAGERITPVQRGWWDVVSKDGHRYELTWRPVLTGEVWSVRYRSADGFETVARTGMAATVLAGMRADSAERSHQVGATAEPESVHVPVSS
ncbi:hypothetical protein PV411_30430 [Streptomyces sp. NRRL_B-16638]|nr:hypothetical protein [Streptomyces sp. NRRL_B-16638]MDX2928841.1 hypothetical protein [Streptomyces sp. NRRL_B-16638]